ncbi:MAG: hypothetical protein ABN478_09150 [Mixta sp.]
MASDILDGFNAPYGYGAATRPLTDGVSSNHLTAVWMIHAAFHYTISRLSFTRT